MQARAIMEARLLPACECRRERSMTARLLPACGCRREPSSTARLLPARTPFISYIGCKHLTKLQCTSH